MQAEVAIHAPNTCTPSAILNVTILLVSICSTNCCWSHWQLQAVLLQPFAQYWEALPCSQSCTFSVHEEAQATSTSRDTQDIHWIGSSIEQYRSIIGCRGAMRLESLFYYWTWRDCVQSPLNCMLICAWISEDEIYSVQHNVHKAIQFAKPLHKRHVSSFCKIYGSTIGVHVSVHCCLNLAA